VTVKRKKTKPAPASYQKRTYRRLADLSGLTAFEVQVRETDLHIMADCNLAQEATDLVIQYRNQLENYISTHPGFLSSLSPLPDDKLAPPIVKAMLAAGQAAEVGPMAAVAGTIAEFIGKALRQKEAKEIIVENGGDIYLDRNRDSIIGIFAGTSPLSNRIGIKIPKAAMPMGICTSSGTVGHSLSLGEADSVTVLAHNTALADATATRLGNEVIAGQDINQALAVGQTIAGLFGLVIIRDEQLGAWGNVELVPLPHQQ
jgi:ApbE superfamily uncharacterized protein (UPF0280 family)